jgi:hypothetical protein
VSTFAVRHASIQNVSSSVLDVSEATDFLLPTTAAYLLWFQVRAPCCRLSCCDSCQVTLFMTAPVAEPSPCVSIALVVLRRIFGTTLLHKHSFYCEKSMLIRLRKCRGDSARGTRPVLRKTTQDPIIMVRSPSRTIFVSQTFLRCISSGCVHWIAVS